MLASKLLSSVSGSESSLYSDDVFVSYLRTGTGADAIITTGIDMTEGYMLMSKSRSAATDWAVYDSARGVTLDLVTNSSSAQTTQITGLKAVSTTGHTVGSLAKMNTSGATYVDYVFKKKAKFFDCGTYTGNGVAGRQIPHSLGVAPGMVILRRPDATDSWVVYHRGIGNTKFLILDETFAETTSINTWQNTDPTATDFTLGVWNNTSGATYVWYAFAHDTSTDGIIQCGSFTTDGSGNATVNLGWEPQYVLIKSATSVQSWFSMDIYRTFSVAAATNVSYLSPNTSGAEAAASNGPYPTATGLLVKGITSSQTYIYLAIRRPNKPPTTGTQVYNAIARTGTGAAATVTGVGFAPDFDLCCGRDGLRITTPAFFDRLRGALQSLESSNGNAEVTRNVSLVSFDMDGVSFGAGGVGNQNTNTFINHFFKRAPGVFETLCYTGSGSNKTESHGLSVAPELWLIKKRSATGNWVFGSSLLSSTEKIIMPSPNGRVTDSTVWNSTLPAYSVISLGTSTDVNASTSTYVGYLWASKPGVSKVFTYTGNGLTQTINCGFSTGARFVMIIRATASTSQDIFVWDSVRGIVSGNDPILSLNTTEAEVTTLDSIDPDVTGFIVNTDVTNINVNGAVYIGLAYA